MDQKDILDMPLEDFWPPVFYNKFYRYQRKTPRDLINDIEKTGVQIEKGKPVVWEWLMMRNIGRKTCEYALELLTRLDYDWSEHIKPFYVGAPARFDGISTRKMERIIDGQIDRLIELLISYRRLKRIRK